MAMMVCPECGQSVSSLAATCPHCGCPIQSNNTKSFSVTLSVQGVGMLAGSFINSAVASVTQAITDDITKKDGTVTNVVNGQIIPVPLMTTQTVTVYYNAPKKIYETNALVQVTTSGFRPQFKWIWK